MSGINNSKPYLLIELLENFTAKELVGLQKIVACSYFNSNHYITKLLDVLVKKIVNKRNLNEAMQLEIYPLIFEDLSSTQTILNKKQKTRFNAKMSELTRLAETFLCIESFKNSDTKRYDLLLNVLLDRKQYRLFSKNIKKVDKLYDTDVTALSTFKFKFSIEGYWLRYLYETGQWLKKDNLNELVKVLDLYFLTNRMDFARTSMTFQRIKPNTNYDLSIFQIFQDKIFNKYFNEDYPFFILEKASLELMDQLTEDSYVLFIEQLRKYENSINNKKLIIAYYTIAQNFCSIMIKKGKLKFLTKQIELLKILDQKNLIAPENSLTHEELRSIILAGCKAGEFDWAFYMAEKYINYIDKKYSKEVKKFNSGYIAFQQKKYSEAIDFLLDVDNFHTNYDLNKRMLILKAYYELEKQYSEPTAQLFRSIEAFVIRNKHLTEFDKRVHKNTIRIFANLYRCKHGIGKMQLNTLKDKVENAKHIASKEWLLEKIEELRKKK